MTMLYGRQIQNQSWEDPASIDAVVRDVEQTVNHAIILADATAGAITVDLLPAIAWAGKALTVKRTNSAGGSVTVDAHGSDLIDGSGTNVLGSQYDAITIVSDGTGWHVLST